MIINNLPWKSPENQNPLARGLRKIFGLLFVASLALNVYFVFSQPQPEDSLAKSDPADSQRQPEKEVAKADPVPITPVAQSTAFDLEKPYPIKKVSFAAPNRFDGRNLRSIQFKIKHSLNHTLCTVLSRPDGCEILSAYISRLLIWFIDIRKQIRNGDSAYLIFEESEGEERFRILKLKYHSQYFNKGFEANYYKFPGPRYGAFFSADGKEISPRIVDPEAPIRDYVEITSLPGDYRKGKFRDHSGTDFKAPTGTHVYSGFDGRVTRRNWNIKANGYSLEIDHPGANVKTRYLHLSRTLVKPGQTVKQGQKIAESGNTGRSFAPHLHYELLSRSAKPTVQNPFKSKAHKTYYRRVPPQRKQAFLKTVALYDSALPSS